MNPLLNASLGLPSDSGRCRVQVHKYHHVGHPTTPWEAQEGGESACASPAAQALPLSLQFVGLTMMCNVVLAGMMEFWSAHTAFLLGARTGLSKRPTPIGHILGMLRVASAHGLWISFIQGRTFHDIQMDGLRYTVAKRENSAKDFRREGERKGARIPCLHYYHRKHRTLPLPLPRCFGADAAHFLPRFFGLMLARFAHSRYVRRHHTGSTVQLRLVRTVGPSLRHAAQGSRGAAQRVSLRSY
jgi:hypothetical protein